MKANLKWCPDCKFLGVNVSEPPCNKCEEKDNYPQFVLREEGMGKNDETQKR